MLFKLVDYIARLSARVDEVFCDSAYSAARLAIIVQDSIVVIARADLGKGCRGLLKRQQGLDYDALLH